MINIHVTKPNRELDNLYKDIYDNDMFIKQYGGLVIISNDSHFTRYIFLKALSDVLSRIGDGMSEIIVYDCIISDSMQVYTVDIKDDCIYESYTYFIRTNLGNFSGKMIPPHSASNPIKNDFNFVESMYNKMELDISFQNISVKYGNKEDYPVRHVQLEVLTAMYRYVNKHNRSDFLHICHEFYDMVRDVNQYSNLRIRKIPQKHNFNMSIYNPYYSLNLCDNVDRMVFNEETGNRYMVGYSTNFKEPQSDNILDNMKHI